MEYFSLIKPSGSSFFTLSTCSYGAYQQVTWKSFLGNVCWAKVQNKWRHILRKLTFLHWFQWGLVFCSGRRRGSGANRREWRGTGASVGSALSPRSLRNPFSWYCRAASLKRKTQLAGSFMENTLVCRVFSLPSPPQWPGWIASPFPASQLYRTVLWQSLQLSAPLVPRAVRQLLWEEQVWPSPVPPWSFTGSNSHPAPELQVASLVQTRWRTLVSSSSIHGKWK